MSESFSTPSSSNIKEIGYNKASETLTVEFKNGNTYNYYDVPEAVFDGMKSAESKGKYLNAQIKNVYRYARQ